MGRHSAPTADSLTPEQIDAALARLTSLERDQRARERNRGRVREPHEKIAALQRQIRALEQTAIEDPSFLAQVIMLAQRLAEVPNVVIATSAARYSSDPRSAPSAGELARLLGMTKQSVSERRAKGDRVLFERQMGVETMTQAERAARTRAARHAEKTLSTWLDRRDEALGQAR